MTRPGLAGCLLVVLAAGLVAGLAGTARAAEADAEHPLVLALYAPSAPMPSAEARFVYIEKLAQKVQGAGIALVGKAFARASDLESAIKRGQIDFAILDALYLAERGVPYPVLAVATAAAETSLRWGLYTTSPSGNLLSLSGQKLAWVALGGKEPNYLDHVLLEGELRVGQFFALRPPAPDVAAAVSDVVLRHADCVFAPEPAVAGKNLRRVYDGGKVINPALVQVQPRLSRALVEQVQRAVMAATSMGVLDGWRQSGAEPYRQLRARVFSKAVVRRLALAEPQPLLKEVHSGMLVKVEPRSVLPPLRGLFVVPSGLP